MSTNSNAEANLRVTISEAFKAATSGVNLIQRVRAIEGLAEFCQAHGTTYADIVFAAAEHALYLDEDYVSAYEEECSLDYVCDETPYGLLCYCNEEQTAIDSWGFDIGHDTFWLSFNQFKDIGADVNVDLSWLNVADAENYKNPDRAWWDNVASVEAH